MTFDDYCQHWELSSACVSGMFTSSGLRLPLKRRPLSDSARLRNVRAQYFHRARSNQKPGRRSPSHTCLQNSPHSMRSVTRDFKIQRFAESDEHIFSSRWALYTMFGYVGENVTSRYRLSRARKERKKSCTIIDCIEPAPRNPQRPRLLHRAWKW